MYVLWQSGLVSSKMEGGASGSREPVVPGKSTGPDQLLSRRVETNGRPFWGDTAAMMMETFRLMEKQYDVVLGPCPGCQLWQLDYTYEAARTYTEILVDEVFEFGSEEPVAFPRVDSSGFHEAVEDALAEHLEECPHLQRALFDFA